MPHGVNSIRTRRQRKYRSQRKHRRQQCQRGGLNYGPALLEMMADIDQDNDKEIIRLLLFLTHAKRIVYDSSTFSFIFELTLSEDYSFIDPFGEPLTAPTFIGRPVNNYCAKISFVADVNISKLYNSITKFTMSPIDATKEATIQRDLFKTFACVKTTAPFVPAVIAHSILTRGEFATMFKILSSGTTKAIYDWIIEWIESVPTISVNVILMEMVDFKRTKFGEEVSDHRTSFQMISSLEDNWKQDRKNDAARDGYIKASIQMASGLAISAGKKIIHCDGHKGNGMATLDGSQVYVIDWGGTYDLSNRADLTTLISYFEELCDYVKVTAAEEVARSNELLVKMNGMSDKQKLLTRWPCLEDLCHFFYITWPSDTSMTTDDVGISKGEKQTQLKQALKVKFIEMIGFGDFATHNIENAETYKYYVHYTLMMIAFIDFMVHRRNFREPYCQCGNMMTVVYEQIDVTTVIADSRIHGVGTFNDFRTFLKMFSVGTVPKITLLDHVVRSISETVKPCSTKQPIIVKRSNIKKVSRGGSARKRKKSHKQKGGSRKRVLERQRSQTRRI